MVTEPVAAKVQWLQFNLTLLEEYLYFRSMKLYEQQGEAGLREISRKQPILKKDVGAGCYRNRRGHGDGTARLRTGTCLQRTEEARSVRLVR